MNLTGPFTPWTIHEEVQDHVCLKCKQHCHYVVNGKAYSHPMANGTLAWMTHKPDKVQVC